MTEIIIIILVIALLLYVLLGGADFGAGIIETFSGKKGIDILSKAIAPIWEANHVWVILAVVILFNGFPEVYTTITTYLHIPLLIVLLGIVLRGSAFTFRYYDVIRDRAFNYYTFLFRASSFITPFFYGIILGAVMMGRISGTTTEGSFYEVFIAPWFNWFCLTTGIFTTLLFGWLAAAYTTGEAKEDAERAIFVKLFERLMILLIISGIVVFVVAELYEVHFFYEFIKSPVSIACVAIATILVPLLIISVRKKKATLSRILAGVQTACIITGWYAIQFPVMVYLSDKNNLTIYNSKAPESTMVMLFWALLVGILIIFPSIGYMMKVFKLNGKNRVASR